MESKINGAAPEQLQQSEYNNPYGYWANFKSEPKGSRVSVFGSGYVRPIIVNMPEQEQQVQESNK